MQEHQENIPDDPVDINLKDFEKFLEKWELHRLHKDFLEKVVLLVITSLGLVSALAWDQALKLVFQDLFGGLETTSQKLLYAAMITVLATILSIWLGKLYLKRKR